MQKQCYLANDYEEVLNLLYITATQTIKKIQ